MLVSTLFYTVLLVTGLEHAINRQFMTSFFWLFSQSSTQMYQFLEVYYVLGNLNEEPGYELDNL